jgi:hypothetical protein
VCAVEGRAVRSRNPAAKLAERALREGWPVPTEKLPELVQVLVDVATSKEAGDRERVSAVKALQNASRINLEALRLSMAAEEFELLRDRLDALGGPGRKSNGGGGEGACPVGPDPEAQTSGFAGVEGEGI